MPASYKVYASYGLRGTQAVFSLITFALAAKVVDDSNGGSGSVAFNIAVGVITLLWLVVLFVPMFSASIPLVGVLIGEFVLWVFWLAAFASMAATYWGAINCNIFDRFDHIYGYNIATTCHVGKAVLAFGVLNWILFSVSLGLLIYFAAVPAFKSKTLTGSGTSGLAYGSIFPSYAGAVDQEAAIGTTEAVPETKEVVVEPTIGELESEPTKAVESDESPVDPVK